MVPIQIYKKFLTDFVQRHMAIIGPHIAVEMANTINGLEVNEIGEVTVLDATPSLVLQDLSVSYQKLCAPITLMILRLLLDENKDIQKDFNQPLPHVKLACALVEDKK